MNHLDRRIGSSLICTLAIIAFMLGQTESAAQEHAGHQLRDLNSYFPFDVPDDLESWEIRKSQLRQQLQISLGLLPFPEKMPLNAVVHGGIDQGDYVIDKVYFESLPGFYVTGNLYRPKKLTGKVPGIISPHGHFPFGRFGEQSDEDIKNDMDSGAETFHSNAKNKLQSRCANLAKMGCIVFLYDMIGYADNQQVSFDIAHRFAKQRPEMATKDSWGLFSPQAESRSQSVMGLQTWNSIRALDFIESLPDVDPTRIGVTGASGGGTQTFMVCALDDRPAAAFPAVMVSTGMQGGCTCENCSYLRIGTGNVEFAAMFAPKPMGLTAADDWTKEMESKGFPELKKLYTMYGKPENVELNARLEFGHNYNQVSREAMYRWFKKHLKFAGDPVETEIEFLKPEVITVFDDAHPRPNGRPEFESQLLQGLAAQKPTDQEAKAFVTSLYRTTDLFQGDVSQPDLSEPGDIMFKTSWFEQLSISRVTEGRGVKLLLIDPVEGQPDSEVKELYKNIFDSADSQHAEIWAFRNLSLSNEDRKQSRRVDNTRESLSYTIGYNPPPIAMQASAWRSVPVWVADSTAGRSVPVFVVALDRAGLEVAINANWLGENQSVAGIIIKTDGFGFEDIKDIRHPDLLPGATKFGDVPGLLSLAAPKPMLLIGADKQFSDTVAAAYAKADAPKKLTLIDTELNKSEVLPAILAWTKEIGSSPK